MILSNQRNLDLYTEDELHELERKANRIGPEFQQEELAAIKASGRPLSWSDMDVNDKFNAFIAECFGKTTGQLSFDEFKELEERFFVNMIKTEMDLEVTDTDWKVPENWSLKMGSFASEEGEEDVEEESKSKEDEEAAAQAEIDAEFEAAQEAHYKAECLATGKKYEPPEVRKKNFIGVDDISGEEMLPPDWILEKIEAMDPDFDRKDLVRRFQLFDYKKVPLPPTRERALKRLFSLKMGFTEIGWKKRFVAMRVGLDMFIKATRIRKPVLQDADMDAGIKGARRRGIPLKRQTQGEAEVAHLPPSDPKVLRAKEAKERLVEVRQKFREYVSPDNPQVAKIMAQTEIRKLGRGLYDASASLEKQFGGVEPKWLRVEREEKEVKDRIDKMIASFREETESIDKIEMEGKQLRDEFFPKEKFAGGIGSLTWKGLVDDDLIAEIVDVVGIDRFEEEGFELEDALLLVKKAREEKRKWENARFAALDKSRVQVMENAREERRKEKHWEEYGKEVTAHAASMARI